MASANCPNPFPTPASARQQAAGAALASRSSTPSATTLSGFSQAAGTIALYSWMERFMAASIDATLIV